jgi:glycosyltransferase involved in cell wall biosynthesis
MNKIAFITQNLYFGGVQRVVSRLANHFAENNHVSIIVFENKPIAFDIDERVKIHTLPEKILDTLVLSKKDVGLTLKAGEELYNDRVFHLKEMVEYLDSDVFVSFEDYNNLISIEAIKSIRGDKKLIVSSRVSIEYQYRDLLTHLLSYDFYIHKIKELYKRADIVVSVSEGVKEELKGLGVESVVIQNGIDINEINTLAREDTEFKDYIVNVGRLYNKQKGQEDLIKAFAIIKDAIKEDLLIIGDGPDRGYLNDLINAFGLEDRIKIIGFAKNPYKYMKNSSFFVFPSYYEGFSNTLIEAMSCGCACISYDFASCMSISDKGKYIKLVKTGNIEGLANVMKEFCKDGDMLSFYKKAAAERAKDFDLSVMLKKWEEVIYN